MSKLAAAVGLGTLAVGGGVGAVAATGGFGSFGNGEAGPTVPVLDADTGTAKVSPHASINLNSSKEITKKYQSLKCGQKFFEKVTLKEEGGDSELSGYRTGNEELSLINMDGCISVWWDKEIYQNSYWKGHWNLLWGMKGGDLGVVFASTVVAENGEAKIDGTVHILKKEGEKWVTIKKKTTNKETVNSDNEKDLIVKAKDFLKQKTEAWNFDFTSQKICSSNNNCTGTATKIDSKSLTWDYEYRASEGNACKQGDSSTKAYQWSSNIEKWIGAEGKLGDITSIYGNTSCSFRLAS